MINHLLISGKGLLGKEVITPEGADLGYLNDLIMDTETGRISFAVIKHGGILGIGDRCYGIPWPLIQLDTANSHILINIRVKDLERAPVFEKEEWRKNAQMSYTNHIYTYFGLEPYFKEQLT